MVSRLTKQYVRTSLGDVHVQKAGKGEQVVVFLSVTSFGGVLMPNTLPRMADLGYCAIAIDLMGYGRSDKRQTDWRMETFADNVEEVCAELGITPRAYVCGHFTGLVGIELAARRTTGLQSLVLDGTPLLTAERRAAAINGPASTPLAWSEDGAHALEYWKMAYGILKRLDPELVLSPAPDETLRQAYIALLDALAFEHGPMQAYLHFDALSRMGEIDIPTLCMCSDVDWNLPHHASIVAALANAQELRWPGAHPLHQWSDPERAQEYVGAIDDFLKKVAAG